MTYEMSLDHEQEQRYEQSAVAEQERSFSEQMQQDNRPVSFGTGKLCACGLVMAEDCKCPPF